MDALTIPMESLLERGALPYEQLAEFALREGRRPRPIYQMHKWFARRLGCAFRALLVGAVSKPTADFWHAYYEEAELRGLTVLDPFVGGGTSVVEALRLGATAIGVDVDPVACAVTRLETGAARLPDLTKALELLKERVGQKIGQFHQIQDEAGRQFTILHHFWVQVVECVGCGQAIEAHPNYVLAHAAKEQWVFCSACGDITSLKAGLKTLRCHCGERTRTRIGPVVNGVLSCRHCGHREALIEVGRRTQAPPGWKLFAVEAFSPSNSRKTVPMCDRRFLKAGPGEQRLFDAAASEFARRLHDGVVQLPSAEIPKVRSDQRLVDYGYRRWTDLFNVRQLLHLSLLADAINEMDEPVRAPMAMAFSNHLATNCMMTAYAAGWRRLTPLFSVRAFRHVPRPVELNPWVDGTGRGSFPNAVRQLARAATFARQPMEPTERGAFRATTSIQPEHAPKILCGTARHLTGLESESVNLVLTDPPYFDNVAYAELADFYAPWLEALGIVSSEERRLVRTEGLSGRREDPTSVSVFAKGLGEAFVEIARVLHPNGMLVFTFRHSVPEAWHALAQALANAPLRAVQVLPMPGEIGVGLHAHEGTITWDAVLVFRKGLEPVNDPLTIRVEDALLAKQHAQQWSRKLEGMPLFFGDKDRANLWRATLAAASRGLFGNIQNGTTVTLLEALQSVVDYAPAT